MLYISKLGQEISQPLYGINNFVGVQIFWSVKCFGGSKSFGFKVNSLHTVIKCVVKTKWVKNSKVKNLKQGQNF